MKARVYVFFKDSVFDPQGNTVSQTLNTMGFRKVKNVRVGKVIDLTLDYSTENQAIDDLKRMCEKLLANPVIESYEYEFLTDKGP